MEVELGGRGAALAAALAACRRGWGVLLAGPAGVGKTRLLRRNVPCM